MPAPTSAAVAPFQVVFCSKYHQPLIVDVVVLLGQFRDRVLFGFHGLALRQLLYLDRI